jgi:hypothetical protein
MKNIFSLVSFLVIFIINFEYFFINAEGIFIISFLLFTFLFYLYAGAGVGSMLDESTIEISRKLKELASIQRNVIKENKETINRLKDLQIKILPLFLFVVFLLEKREDLLKKLQTAHYRNFIEKRCKELLIEQSLLTVEINNQIIKEVLDSFESKLK